MNNIRQILNNASEEITIENFNEMYNCLKILNSKAKQNKNIDELKELIQLIFKLIIFIIINIIFLLTKFNLN